MTDRGDEIGYEMTDVEITRSAARHMGETAWPTVVLAVASVAAYGALIALCALGWLGLLPAFLLASYLVYATYTPLHEAVHRNICGRRRDLLWLNHLLGYVVASVLGVSYTMHRSAHMAHHRATNVEGEDPDLVTRGRSLWDVLSCGSKMVASEYRDYFTRVFPKAPVRERTTVVVEILVFGGSPWR